MSISYKRKVRNRLFFSALLLSISLIVLCVFMSWDEISTKVAYPNLQEHIDQEVLNRHVDIEGHGVFTFHNVCLENSKSPVHRNISRKHEWFEYDELQSIVVYNSQFSSYNHRFLVGAHSNIKEKNAWWSIRFVKDSVPKGNKLVKNTAFFVLPSCPGNLHHFWEDEFVYLLDLVNASGSLYSGADNYILYREPPDLSPDDMACRDVKTFDSILQALYIHNHHDVYYRVAADGTCFDRAVFGIDRSTKRIRDVDLREKAVNWVLKRFNFSRKVDCSSTHGKTRVTIILRRTRTILNIDKLVQYLQRNESLAVDVVRFEEFAVDNQIKIAACTDVLVGVQGSSLQWAMFMKKGSRIVEIAWPSTFWNFYYHNMAARYDLHHFAVDARTVAVNWEVYERNQRNGAVVNQSERMELLHQVPKSLSFDNIFKWADITVDERVLYKAVTG